MKHRSTGVVLKNLLWPYPYLGLAPCSRLGSCACNLRQFLCGQSILRNTALGCTIPGLFHSLAIPRAHQQTYSFVGIRVYARPPNRKLYTSSVDPRWWTIVFRNFVLHFSASADSSTLTPLRRSNNDRVSECGYSLVAICRRLREEFANTTAGAW